MRAIARCLLTVCRTFFFFQFCWPISLLQVRAQLWIYSFLCVGRFVKIKIENACTNAMPLKLNKGRVGESTGPGGVGRPQNQAWILNRHCYRQDKPSFKTFHLDYLIHRSVSENYVIIVFFRKLERAYLVLAFRGKVAFSGSIRAACKQGMPMQWSELPERKTIRRGASTSIFPDLVSCFDLYFMTRES